MFIIFKNRDRYLYQIRKFYLNLKKYCLICILSLNSIVYKKKSNHIDVSNNAKVKDYFNINLFYFTIERGNFC